METVSVRRWKKKKETEKGKQMTIRACAVEASSHKQGVDKKLIPPNETADFLPLKHYLTFDGKKNSHSVK